MRVALVGTGIMGAPMADRLLAAGHSVVAYNRTASKLAPLIERGVEPAPTPADAAKTADVVISMVTDPAAVREVALGPYGILDALPASSVHCDMSTVTPQSAKDLAGRYGSASKMFVQAPVLGSKKQIAEQTLIVLAGGDDAAIDLADQAWSAFVGQVRRFPAAEQASTAKLAANMLIAQMILGLGQSLVFARAGGVEPQVVLDIIQSSNLAAPMYGSKGKSLIERNFVPNFVVRNMLKDIELANQAAGEAGIRQPMNAAAREIFLQAVEEGFGDEDYSAAVKVLESLANLS
jgi:3-hydroxyisobutyrate dehydrogenase-like beta-hydroxyacid dehydrogenase